jgi:hypothetical protein
MDTRVFFWEVNWLEQEVNHLPPSSTFTATICLHDMKRDDFTFYLDSKNRSLHFKNTGCPGRNVKNFGRVFLMLKYNDITQNTYIQS